MDRNTPSTTAGGNPDPPNDSFSFAHGVTSTGVQYADYGTSNVQEELITDMARSDGRSLSTLPSVEKHQSYRKCLKLTAILLLLAGGLTLLVYFFDHRTGCAGNRDTDACDILCSGILLQTIQFSGLFNDSKTFVDMPMQRQPQCILEEFNKLPSYDQATLYDFVISNFEPSCSDMHLWRPPDFADEPPFLANIVDPTLNNWANEINDLWNLLGRSLDQDVYDHPERHTLLPLRSPNMIVPGGRFCEFYYWDTYWIIQGLLVSDMVDTAREIVDNFIGLVQDYGFVPNGSRQYYLNRSQPPMLTLMVKEVFDRTQDLDWLKSLLPILEQEYSYWMDPGTRAVNVTDHAGKVHTLNRYYSNSTRPRPESYVADEMTAWLLHNMTRLEEMSEHHKERMQPLSLDRVEVKSVNEALLYQTTNAFRDLAHFVEGKIHRTPPESMGHAARPSFHSRQATKQAPPDPPVPNFQNESNIDCLFAELTAGAESGWDFSSRWFHDRFNLTSVETMDLIPVDLNAILFVVEKQLASFFTLINESEKAQLYTSKAQSRMVAIDAILWNAENAQWQDYHFDQHYWKSEVMLSNFIPLWAKCYDKALVDEPSVISALLQSGLVMSGGIVTTLNNNTQQWDFPNAWAPLQWMIVQGIEDTDYESSSTFETFTVYNSSNLKPHELPPAHACDITYPETWFNCTTSGDCVWCFPAGADLSKALALRWLTSNYLAWNTTGYMLEKYFAPQMGSPGAGGEYRLQKGFGWTNGVALHFLTKYANDTNLDLEKMLTQPYPYPDLAAYVDTSPLLPEHAPKTISSQPIAKVAKTFAHHAEATARNGRHGKKPKNVPAKE